MNPRVEVQGKLFCRTFESYHEPQDLLCLAAVGTGLEAPSDHQRLVPCGTLSGGAGRRLDCFDRSSRAQGPWAESTRSMRHI